MALIFIMTTFYVETINIYILVLKVYYDNLRNKMQKWSKTEQYTPN